MKLFQTTSITCNRKKVQVHQSDISSLSRVSTVVEKIISPTVSYLSSQLISWSASVACASAAAGSCAASDAACSFLFDARRASSQVTPAGTARRIATTRGKPNCRRGRRRAKVGHHQRLVTSSMWAGAQDKGFVTKIRYLEVGLVGVAYT